MKKSLKFLLLALIVVPSIVVLAACGKAKDNPTPSSPLFPDVQTFFDTITEDGLTANFTAEIQSKDSSTDGNWYYVVFNLASRQSYYSYSYPTDETQNYEEYDNVKNVTDDTITYNCFWNKNGSEWSYVTWDGDGMLNVFSNNCYIPFSVDDCTRNDNTYTWKGIDQGRWATGDYSVSTINIFADKVTASEIHYNDEASYNANETPISEYYYTFTDFGKTEVTIPNEVILQANGWSEEALMFGIMPDEFTLYYEEGYDYMWGFYNTDFDTLESILVAQNYQFSGKNENATGDWTDRPAGVYVWMSKDGNSAKIEYNDGEYGNPSGYFYTLTKNVL